MEYFWQSLEREVSIFLLSRLQEEKIVYLHVDADLISSHLSSLSDLVLIIDLSSCVTGYYNLFISFPDIINWHNTIRYEEVWSARTRYVPCQL